MAYLLGAVILALLLPSGLTLPNRGPSTLAEYAPVPGQGQGASPIAGLGQTSSNGIGAAGSSSPPSTVAPDEAPGAARVVKRPGSKRCVGSPPRQTEDPLSPPCVAFFEGDNGGATAKGVTRDEVTVVMRGNDRSSDQLVDCAGPPASSDDAADSECRAYMHYFNDRYQTYGRTVHLWDTHSLSAADIENRLRPFASIATMISKTTLWVDYNGQFPNFYSPQSYKYTFRPSFADAAAMEAAFVCTKLVGRPAGFAGDPLLQSQVRKFAIWSDAGETYLPVLRDALAQTCDLKPQVEANGATQDTTATPARLHQAGVTSVILLLQNAETAVASQQATEQGFLPEWILSGKPWERLADVNFYGRLADQNQWRHAFGITTDYRRDQTRDQFWYQAYHEGCPDCPEPTGTTYSGAYFTYDNLALLFRAIQAAGPRLGIASADKGMHAIPPNGSPDPYKPAAYFSPGNYSYVKDAVAIWWDPSGRAPGQANPGCYRLVENGRRSRAGEWKTGDSDLFAGGADAPCQGDPFQS